ncbi:MAG: DUF6629 family protein [Spirulina sp.]
MCFSVAASVAASAVLIPTGIYGLGLARTRSAYWPLALVPLAFGLQQGFEGIVWWGMNANDLTMARVGALLFLFFSHWFWLVWLPFLALHLETHPRMQAIDRCLMGLGALYGAFLYLPLLWHPDWVSVTVIQHSIEYQAHFIGESIPVVFSRLLYTSILLIPLMFSSELDIRIWGGLIALLACVSYLVFNYAFVSIWCFLAALLSLCVVFMLGKVQPSLPERFG